MATDLSFLSGGPNPYLGKTTPLPPGFAANVDISKIPPSTYTGTVGNSNPFVNKNQNPPQNNVVNIPNPIIPNINITNPISPSLPQGVYSGQLYGFAGGGGGLDLSGNSQNNLSSLIIPALAIITALFILKK